MPEPRFSLPLPTADATPIFEHFRGSYGTELLTAAVAHFDFFQRLAEQPRLQAELGQSIGLEERAMQVLTTALRAMGVVAVDDWGRLKLTELGEHLVPGSPFDVSDYVGLAATSPGVLEMVERLKTNRPTGLDEGGDGAAFIYRQGIRSAMDQQALSEHFTMALAGRAKNVAPVLAERLDWTESNTLLDIGGGTGIYSIAILQRNPRIRATVLDRPEVLQIARRLADQAGVGDRMTFLAGDMFEDAMPTADVVLLSNILHDWDVPECERLIGRAAAALSPLGKLIIHDVLLDDDLGGPLPIALYSAALFTLTEGRAYSGAEYCRWLQAAGLTTASPLATAIHCHAIIGTQGLERNRMETALSF